MYFLAGHRNYSFVLTKASAVDKCNKAGDVYGKMLVLTFEDNEDAMMNRILSLINTKEVLMQQQLRIIQYQKQRIQDLVLVGLHILILRLSEMSLIFQVTLNQQQLLRWDMLTQKRHHQTDIQRIGNLQKALFVMKLFKHIKK